MLVLLLLVGLPAVGKSTLAKQIAARLPVVHFVSYDEIIGHKLDLEATTWKAERQRVQSHVSCLVEEEQRKAREECSGGREETERAAEERPRKLRVILIDDNFFYHSMRQVYRQMADEKECGFAQIFVSVTKEEKGDDELNILLDRNRSRPKDTRVDDDTIRRMKEALEVPRGPDVMHVTADDKPETVVTELTTFLLTCHNMSNSLREERRAQQAAREADRRETAASAKHAAELAARRVIGETMRAAKGKLSGKALGQLSKSLAVAKADAMAAPPAAMEEVDEWAGRFREAASTAASNLLP